MSNSNQFFMVIGESLVFGIDWNAFLLDEGTTISQSSWNITPSTGLIQVGSPTVDGNNVALIQLLAGAKGLYRMRNLITMANGQIKAGNIQIEVRE